MNTFESIHQEAIEGSLSMFDRMLFKGHIQKMYFPNNITWFLYRQGVKLVDFKGYVIESSEKIKRHALGIAQQAGRRFEYLKGVVSHHSTGMSKEEYARQIAAEEGIQEGLVCVFSTVEQCQTFGVRKNAEGMIEAYSRSGQCLHYYFYYLDVEFGLMHIRLQSWLPYTIQVYINGREWLGRQLNQREIQYERYENSFTHIEDLKTAQELCEKFGHNEWAPLLKAFAKRVNPLLEVIQAANFGEYYWVTDQCEYATDIMFRDRAHLEKIMPDLYEQALLQGSPEDVMRFLGRKAHGRFEGEVVTDLKKRPQGWRIKYRIKRNTLKLYDKASVLRVETTINNPRDFKVSEATPDQKRRWKTMGKGVSNLWRYREVSQQANARFLEGLAQAKLKSEAVQHLDDLCPVSYTHLTLPTSDLV